jgi:hypothetical protein
MTSARWELPMAKICLPSYSKGPRSQRARGQLDGVVLSLLPGETVVLQSPNVEPAVGPILKMKIARRNSIFRNNPK